MENKKHYEDLEKIYKLYNNILKKDYLKNKSFINIKNTNLSYFPRC